MPSADPRPEGSLSGKPSFVMAATKEARGPGGGNDPAGKRHSATVNRLRGYALVLILIYHGGAILDVPNVIHGESGVDIFLMISGYVLALSCVDLPAAVFLRRRFLRIFPAYWVALILFVFLQVQLTQQPCTWTDFILHFLGLHSFSRTKYLFGINQSFWFVSIILFLYVVFLGVRNRLDDLDFVARSGALTTAALAVYLIASEHYVSVAYMVPRVPDFFIGLVAGQWASGRGVNWRPRTMLAVALIVLGYVSVAYGVDYADVLRGGVYTGIFVCAETGLAVTAIGRSVLWALALIGTYSYELYLVHQPLMRDYSRIAMLRLFDIAEPSKMQLFLGMLAGFAVACLAAYWLHSLTGLITRKTTGRGPGGFAGLDKRKDIPA
jgi:exopolysaccharide production protein ExoZ